MRYTEARLSPIAAHYCVISSRTVDFILNFDGTEEEPTQHCSQTSSSQCKDRASALLPLKFRLMGRRNYDAVIYLLTHKRPKLEDLLEQAGTSYGPLSCCMDVIQQAYKTAKVRLP